MRLNFASKGSSHREPFARFCESTSQASGLAILSLRCVQSVTFPHFPFRCLIETVTVFDSIALVGATGAVGRIVLQQLQERGFPYKQLRLLSSARSAGTTVVVNGKSIKVELLEPSAFKGVDLVIASTPDEVAMEFVPWAVEAGAVVVDESAYWRMDPECSTCRTRGQS